MIVLVIVLILLVLLSFVWPPDSPWSPWWRTSKEVARKACKLASVSKKDVVYELGSGDGEFILTAVSEFGAKKAIGIEIDYSRYLISKMKKKKAKLKNAEFVRRDFKEVNLRGADVVYFYLVPRVIDRIMPKLKKELKPGTRIVSYKYKLPMKKIDRKGNLFLYKI
jgi:predicted RNA methylase